MYFCNRFLQAVFDGVLDLKHNIFHLSGYVSAQNSRYCSSINMRQTLEVPLYN
jgi:hypothetical protein